MTEQKQSYPWARLVLHFGILVLTSNVVAVPDALQQMMLMNGAFSGVPMAERILQAKAVTGWSMSVQVLSGLVVGIFYDSVGPKATGTIGQGMLATAMYSLILSNNKLLMYLGATLLGISFQAIFLSHLGLAACFPGMSSVVMAIIGAAPDISTLVPTVLVSQAIKLGSAGAVINAYILIVLGCAALDFVVLPLGSFAAVEEAPEEENLVKKSEENSEKVEAKQSAAEQATSLSFILFTLWFLFQFIRRVFLSQNIREIFVIQMPGNPEAASAWTSFFLSAISVGFITAIIWGIVVEQLGFCTAFLMVHGFLLIPNFLLLQNSEATRLPAIVSQVTGNSYLFGVMFSFLGNVFGFETLSTLQGIICTFTGLSSMALGYVMPILIMAFGVIGCLKLFTVLSLLLTIVPVYIYAAESSKTANEEFKSVSQAQLLLSRKTLAEVAAADTGKKSSKG
eukprot:GHVP01005109.1.p1 GENE.GHVP01005109.1~~GHVP01005109.1.p1  ORF type:complete len:453 (+),score=76.03 GHVP01005109.1:1232-2590(+)